MLETSADIYLIAVSDDAIRAIAAKLPALKGIVAHTAGSVSREVLAAFDSGYGVFYPLQSLKAGTDALMPVLVDGCNDRVTGVLIKLAEGISPAVHVASDRERAGLHLAATVVNNFSTHLFRLAHQYCRQEGLPFAVLLPLIHNTVDKLSEADPRLLQTGPASRKDYGTIEKHLLSLENYPQLKTLYTAFSASIIESVDAEKNRS